VTARNLGAAACRTSNKIILTTSLNYARGTNNNICSARIPAINIEGVSGSLSLLPLPRRRSRNPRAYPLHGTPRRGSCSVIWSRGPPIVPKGTLRKGAWPRRSDSPLLSPAVALVAISWILHGNNNVGIWDVTSKSIPRYPSFFYFNDMRDE